MWRKRRSKKLDEGYIKRERENNQNIEDHFDGEKRDSASKT